METWNCLSRRRGRLLPAAGGGVGVARRWARVLHCAALLLLPWLMLGPAHAQCGAEGERPCVLTERLPSCDVNLIEAGGRCIRPACGREGERPCGPERLLWDFVLKAPVPQPCDVNLKLDILRGQCIRPPCGRAGERACTVLERLPSDLAATRLRERVAEARALPADAPWVPAVSLDKL